MCNLSNVQKVIHIQYCTSLLHTPAFHGGLNSGRKKKSVKYRWTNMKCGLLYISFDVLDVGQLQIHSLQHHFYCKPRCKLAPYSVLLRRK